MMNSLEIFHPIDGLPIRKCDFMAGAKHAVKADGIIHVSPAIMDLIHHTKGDELKRLLNSISVLDLDKLHELFIKRFGV